MRRSPLVCLLLAGVSAPALADDLTITNQVNSPVFTATAANNSPGDITVEVGGSVNASLQGAAATINSNNSIDNSGVIQNTSTSNGAVGVHLIGGNLGTFTNEPATTTEIRAGGNVITTGGNGNNNIGLLLDGNAAFNGNISLGYGSNVIALGTNSIGIAIQAPLNGTLNQGATANLVGSNVSGVIVTAPISGALTSTGAIAVAGNYSDLAKAPNPYAATEVQTVAQFSTTNFAPTATNVPTAIVGPAAAPTGNLPPAAVIGGTPGPATLVTPAPASVLALYPISGSAMAVGSSIGGGILNAGPLFTGDTTPAAYLTSASTSPTLAIQPSVAGTGAGNIVIGGSADTTNPDFSFLNRGIITDSEKLPGISTIGVQIGETANAPYTTTLTGGILNGGTISAIAETDNLTDPKKTQPASSNATALVVGSGAIINASNATAVALLNTGTISSSVSGTLPTVSTALLIQPGGSLPTLSNLGAITASATTTTTALSIPTLTSYAIRDLSGTLTSITNSGTIAASSTLLNNNAQQNIAIDISHSSANETIDTSGTVLGDVIFGSAGMNGAIAGNQLVIGNVAEQGTGAAVDGNITVANGGTLDIQVSPGGTGGVLDTGSTQITRLTVGEAGTVQVALNQNSAGSPVISATGPVSFGFGSQVSLLPTSFLPNNGTYTLIHSNASLTFSDFTAATQQPIPYLFNGAITQNGNDLVVSLQRKTAAQLGLTGNAAVIYEPLAESALTDDPFGAALLTLTNAQDVQTAINANVPDLGAGTRALVIAMTDSTTGVVGARERNLVLSAANQQDEFRFWAQEVYDQVGAGTTAIAPGYSGDGQGIAAGVEFGALPDIRYGLAFTFFATHESQSHPADNSSDGDWHLLSLYAGWRPGNFFVTPELNFGQADYTSTRGITIGSALSRAANANWNDYLGSGAVTTGYVLPFGVFQIVPEFSVDGLYLHQNNINEKNAGAADLSITDGNNQSLRGFAGVITQGAMVWAGGTLQPQLLLGWSYDFLHKPGSVTAAFEQAPSASFQLTAPDSGASRFVGGIGINYSVGNWSAGINYDASLATGSVTQAATFSLSSRF